MIEVNLLPGKETNPSRRAFSLALPTFSGFARGMDRWVMAAGFALVGAVAGVAFLWFSADTARVEIDLALTEATRDSTRFADIIERSDLLQARSDSVIQRVAVIQEIDEGRYVWPHALDEVARALPEYTWLEQVLQVSASKTEVRMKVGGKAGNYFALAVFMDQLEASPFLRDVDLVVSEQTVEESRQVVYAFDLEATFATPPLEYLQTVPLFGGSMPQIERLGSLDPTGN